METSEPTRVDRCGCLQPGNWRTRTLSPVPTCLMILASTEIPEADVTKAQLKCFVIVSFIFLFLLLI